MAYERPAAPSVRPSFLSCFAATAGLVLAGAFAILFLAFLDSGADDGKVVLDDARAYADGSIEYISAHNLYLVRLRDGFYALSDLDAANRASPGRRCRAAPLAAGDARLPALLETYRSGFSAAAAGSTLLFREDCRGAVYDVTGVRLDAEGPNLDRYPVSVRDDGRVVVDARRRTCTHRSGPQPFAPIACP